MKEFSIWRTTAGAEHLEQLLCLPVADALPLWWSALSSLQLAIPATSCPLATGSFLLPGAHGVLLVLQQADVNQVGAWYCPTRAVHSWDMLETLCWMFDTVMVTRSCSSSRNADSSDKTMCFQLSVIWVSVAFLPAQSNPANCVWLPTLTRNFTHWIFSLLKITVCRMTMF